jgi:hypothetical protein
MSHPPGIVKDASQVAQAVGVLARADRSGELDSWFDPPVSAAERQAVECEEAWILGPEPGDVAGS